MPLGSILATVAAYAAIAVLLLSLNLTSRWRWWIKGGAIVLTGVFFIGSYIAITSLLGWPTQARVPDRFSLISTRVVEPDNFTSARGAIYLWLEVLDENNVPNMHPRSYQLTYTPELAAAVQVAQEMLDRGEAVEGTIEAAEGEDAGNDGDGGEAGQPGQARGRSSYLPVEFNLIFNDMPPVALPDKGVL
jgi:hypothetical protein